MPAHIQLLMNNGNARFLRLLRRQITVFFSENLHGTAISCIDATENLHQSRFPRPVFSQQCHDFPRTQFKAYIIQSLYTREALTDALHRDNNFTHPLTPSLSALLIIYYSITDLATLLKGGRILGLMGVFHEIVK